MKMEHEESAWNPRYVLWAKRNGNEPEDQLAEDKKTWPGGCMVGFSLWIQAAWRQLHNERYSCCDTEREMHMNHMSLQAEFDLWLEENYRGVACPSV